MKKILFITSRKAKVEWANQRLKDFGIRLSHRPFEFSEIRSFDVVQVAREKARQVSNKIRQPFIVEDSGFYIKALNGFPATQTNFVLETIGARGILRLLKNENNRGAEFRSAVVYFDGRKIKVFKGEYKGSVAKRMLGPKTWGWSELFKIWLPHGFKSPCRMTKKEWLRYQIVREENGPYLKFARWIAKP